MVGVGARDHCQTFHPQGPGGDIDHLPPPRQIIGTVAVDFHGRKLRRRLQYFAPELRQMRVDLIRLRSQIRGGDHLTLGIIGVGGRPQPHQKPVAFQRIGDVGHGLCSLAQRHRQNAGCGRVKRACVACLLFVERPTNLAHNGG